MTRCIPTKYSIVLPRLLHHPEIFAFPTKRARSSSRDIQSLCAGVDGRLGIFRLLLKCRGLAFCCDERRLSLSKLKTRLSAYFQTALGQHNIAAISRLT